LGCKYSSIVQVIRDAHREDVRKRLAMSTPADSTYGDLYSRTSNKPLRGQNSAMELYVNECNDEVNSWTVKYPVGDGETDFMIRKRF